MARYKRKKMINCIYFPRRNFNNKDSVKQWLFNNKNKIDFSMDKTDFIKKSDKDYFMKIRALNKFKKTEKTYFDGAKIIKGFLK